MLSLRVVILSEQTTRSESILLQLFQPLEHSSNEVTRHENHSELVVILVIPPPNRVVLVVKVFPEPSHTCWFFIVGIKPLPLLQIESSFGHISIGILCFGSAGARSMSSSSSLGFFFSFFSSGFFFSCAGFFSFTGLSFLSLPENSANFLASNSAIFEHRTTCPKTANTLGWLTTVVNHLVTFMKGFLNSESRTCLYKASIVQATAMSAKERRSPTKKVLVRRWSFSVFKATLMSSLALSVAFLLNCMMPMVGKTQVQAAGKISLY